MHAIKVACIVTQTRGGMQMNLHLIAIHPKIPMKEDYMWWKLIMQKGKRKKKKAQMSE